MTQTSSRASQDGGAPGGGPAPASRQGAGSLADLVAPTLAVRFSDSFPWPTRVKILVLAVLMVAAHIWQLQLLVRKWVSDPDWTHGFIIPLFSLYLLYSRRDELMTVRRKTDFWGYLGLIIAVLALAAQPLCVFPIRNYWLMQIAMVGVLFGVVLYLGGSSVIRLTWLPILFLLFALPIAPNLYVKISLPLQEVAAKGAALFLRLLRVDIKSVASSLTLISRRGLERHLTVAEACNGMRLLMAFCALAVAMAYLDYKPIWQRAILVAAGVPIAILCNIVRVAITAWMYYIDKEEMGQDFMHYFTGILMLIPAFLMLWALAWVLKNLFVEGDDQDAAGASAEVAS